MGDIELLANIAFAEASKDKNFRNDAIGVMSVVNNRLKRPERFGNSYEEVIFAPHQFSGVGSNEWNKAINKQFTQDEEKLYKQLLQIAHGVTSGAIPDNTGGADHYYNPLLAAPTWAKEYKKTYSSGSHDYHSELMRKGTKTANNMMIQKALNEYGAGLKVDGKIGKKTKEAIKKFQADNGLKADGIVGEQTSAYLFPDSQ